MTMPAHTPTPWQLKDHNRGALWVEDGMGVAIAELPDWLPEVFNPRAANAALIVRSVNAHEALVDALARLLTWPDNEHVKAQARDALALAQAA